MNSLDTLIIGAGMAGLTAARVLVQHGHSVLIVDKGRGVGGRVATRRLGEARADHGAASFRLDSGPIGPFWHNALAGLSRQPAPQALDAAAWICTGGMSMLPKAMAQGLPVLLQKTVTELRRESAAWICQTQEGDSWQARKVLVTSPLAQTAAFFQKSDPQLAAELNDISRAVPYDPQWTLIVKLAGEHDIPGPVYQVQPHPLIASIYDQGRKGLPQAKGVAVVHASREFSMTHVEGEAAVIIEVLRGALHELGWNLAGADMQAHRWRYARVQRPLAQDYLAFDAAPGLFAAGDFCRESTVQGAARSAWAAAQAMLSC